MDATRSNFLYCFGILLLSLFGTMAEAQSYRVSYIFHKKGSTGKYVALKDMNLEYDSDKSIYYCERAFLKDSLRKLAFDENNQIKDQGAYESLSGIRGGTSDMTILDFTHSMATQYYIDGNSYLAGEISLEMPAWTITQDTVSFKGYLGRKATATYLGREWQILYTDEIPLQIGPWMLWGAPGLILYAKDVEKNFVFEFVGITTLDHTDRWPLMMDRHINPGGNGSFYSGNLKIVEKLHTKYKTDSDYFSQNLGGILTMTDKGGMPVQWTLPPYTPLIPIDYWKKDN